MAKLKTLAGAISSSKLTNGERLLVARRRRDETQNEAAKRMRLTPYTYRRLESDKPVAIDRARCVIPKLGRLREHEVLFLMRVRAGVKIGPLAERIGCARWWLARMERGEAQIERLRAWWRGRARSLGGSGSRAKHA